MANVLKRQMTYNVIIVLLLTILIVLWSRYILISVTQTKMDSGLDTNHGRISLLLGYGWQVEEEPVETATFTIPEQFDEVYQNYYKLQKSWGFDISPYKGKEVTRYTYKVVDYPYDVGTNVYANVIVYGDRFVCGEIYTRELDGFMHSIVRGSLPRDAAGNKDA